MNIDWSELLSALGGGASAVLILLLVIAVGWLARLLVQQINARLEDMKVHAAENLESSRLMSKAVEDLRVSGEAMRELARGRNV